MPAISAASVPLLPLPLLRRGKVREVYEVDAERLLIVASDRVSAFDVVMREAVPFKGAVLTQLTAWWLQQLDGRVEHHMLASDSDAIVAAVPSLAPCRGSLRGRAMLCRRTTVFPVECVVRGYLAGSAWKEYSACGTLAGEALPPGLQESAQLPEPLFSPASKAESGHDENITPSAVETLLGSETARELERLSRLVYEFGRAIAWQRGIVVADTKFEFGERDGRILLIDEALTPDSSRFWPAAGWTVGSSPPSYDKQPLRDYLDAERKAGRWNGDAPPPTLPAEVVDATSRRYLDIFERLTGASLLTAELS